MLTWKKWIPRIPMIALSIAVAAYAPLLAASVTGPDLVVRVAAQLGLSSELWESLDSWLSGKCWEVRDERAHSYDGEMLAGTSYLCHVNDSCHDDQCGRFHDTTFVKGMMLNR